MYIFQMAKLKKPHRKGGVDRWIWRYDLEESNPFSKKAVLRSFQVYFKVDYPIMRDYKHPRPNAALHRNRRLLLRPRISSDSLNLLPDCWSGSNDLAHIANKTY